MRIQRWIKRAAPLEEFRASCGLGAGEAGDGEGLHEGGDVAHGQDQRDHEERAGGGWPVGAVDLRGKKGKRSRLVES